MEVIKEAKIVTKPAFKVAGLLYHGRPEGNAIPTLWERFAARMGELHDAVHPEVCYGAGDNMDEQTGEFDYLAACEVKQTAELPEGMVGWEIPAATYAVFTTTLPAIGKTFEEIYNQWLPSSGYRRASGPEFEYYDARFDPNDPNSIFELYIPVEKV
ncbi:MAG: AraC family transcriptional regulator [Caldilineaceae bacterium]|nr:AraC family transcriptional regulator [Caldilineaceae bacterium]